AARVILNDGATILAWARRRAQIVAPLHLRDVAPAVEGAGLGCNTRRFELSHPAERIVVPDRLDRGVGDRISPRHRCEVAKSIVAEEGAIERRTGRDGERAMTIHRPPRRPLRQGLPERVIACELEHTLLRRAFDKGIGGCRRPELPVADEGAAK